MCGFKPVRRRLNDRRRLTKNAHVVHHDETRRASISARSTLQPCSYFMILEIGVSLASNLCRLAFFPPFGPSTRADYACSGTRSRHSARHRPCEISRRSIWHPQRPEGPNSVASRGATARLLFQSWSVSRQGAVVRVRDHQHESLTDRRAICTDLLWGNEFPQPRYGQGALQESMAAVYKTVTGHELQR
jgi:hypothetical protein